MLRFSMTHTCSHLEHNHAPSPLPPPQGHLWDVRERVETTGSRSQLAQKALCLSRQAGGGGGGWSVLLLGKVWNLDLNHRSPILRKFCLLKSLSPCLQKNVHLSKTGLCLPNTKIRSTFVNQKIIPPYLIYSTGSPYMQSPITTFFIFLTHNLTKRMRNE